MMETSPQGRMIIDESYPPMRVPYIGRPPTSLVAYKTTTLTAGPVQEKLERIV